MDIVIDTATLIWAFLLALGVPTSITSFFLWRLKRKIEKQESERDKKEAARRQNEIIVIENVMAAIALSEATAKAVQRIPDAQCNGDMHAALEYATQIKHKHREFITKHGIEALY